MLQSELFSNVLFSWTDIPDFVPSVFRRTYVQYGENVEHLLSPSEKNESLMYPHKGS